MDDRDVPTSTCKNCGVRICYGYFVKGEWAHMHGGTWCREPNSTFTRTPLSRAEPVLETEVL